MGKLKFECSNLNFLVPDIFKLQASIFNLRRVRKWSELYLAHETEKLAILKYRAVASLTISGGQKFHFPHFSSNRDQFFLFFLKLCSFSSSFWPSGWATRPHGKALATLLLKYCVYGKHKCKSGCILKSESTEKQAGRMTQTNKQTNKQRETQFAQR